MKRPIRVEGNDAFIPLTKGYTAIIDAADVPLVEAWNWYAMLAYARDGSVRAVYARRNYRIKGRVETLLLHQIILQTVSGMDIDHRDGDGLNCRRENLRMATRSQNSMNRPAQKNNTSGFKGVTWNRALGKWQSAIKVKGKTHYLGVFHTIAAAAEAYAAASAKLHGEFGRAA